MSDNGNTNDGGETKTTGTETGSDTQKTGTETNTGNENTTQGGEQDKNTDGDLSSFPKAAQELISSLRAESAKHRKTAQETKRDLESHKKKLSDIANKELEDQNKFKELYENSQAEAKKRDKAIIRSEIRLHASRQGILDLDMAQLIPEDGIEITDTGEVIGAEEAVNKFKESKNNWFKAPEDPANKTSTTTTTATGSSTTSPPPGRQDLSKESVLALTDEEYDKQESQFLSARKSGR